MIKINNSIVFYCREVAMGAHIVDCSIRDFSFQDISNVDQMVFDNLMDRQFYLHQEKVGRDPNFKIDNYGNFQLAKIKFDSFKTIPPETVQLFLKNHFESIFTSDEIDPAFKERYISTILSMVELFSGGLENNFNVYVLDIEKLEKQDIKHEFVSWYENFITLFIVYKGDRLGDFTYLDFGFD
jgi:hypothetical protein